MDNALCIEAAQRFCEQTGSWGYPLLELAGFAIVAWRMRQTHRSVAQVSTAQTTIAAKLSEVHEQVKVLSKPPPPSPSPNIVNIPPLPAPPDLSRDASDALTPPKGVRLPKP